MNLLGPHVVDVLGIVGAPLRLAGADKLIGLKDDLPNAALAYPGIFAAFGVDPVHHHAGHRFHASLSLASRLTLDQTRQQFSVRKGHIHHTPVAASSYSPEGTAVTKNTGGANNPSGVLACNQPFQLFCGSSVSFLRRFSLRLLQRLLQSPCQLVRAGGVLEAAADALQPGNGLLRRQSLHQDGDALQIAAAAAQNLQVLNHMGVVQLHPHMLGTNALGTKFIYHFLRLLFSLAAVSGLSGCLTA